MLHRHGIGRHSRDERMALAARDIAAVSTLLGDKPFLFGDCPSAVDAAAFGELASCGTRFFDSKLPSIIDAHPNLRQYLARMDTLYFSHVTSTQAA
jgi:glutathione S-transferase